ncbi:MAG: hypothetical protein M1822_009648 [Bathelium mastoideum]|nr:MAG: hypothetical protein M1822_009648 [Bathelium mastoideum]
MRLFATFPIVSTLLAPVLASEATKQQVTVYAWPLSASKPQVLAEVTYDTQSLSARAQKYHQPAPVSAEELVRVGLYDTKTADWVGVVTSGSQFVGNNREKTLTLHLDQDGRPFHVGFGASAPSPSEEKKQGKGKTAAAGEGGLNVVVKTPVRGPQPHLNKPIVLSQDGKLQEKEPEKTFLQKYWWAIALFIGLQIFSAVGGGDKS